jgi:enoyl-CoA hydratase/carnithine racemase
MGLILTGDRLTGSQAASWGLAYRACAAGEFNDAVEETAQKLAAKSAEALARCKRLVYDGLGGSLEDGLALELETVLEHLQSSAAAQGIESFSR